jgi:hypothetical protein
VSLSVSLSLSLSLSLAILGLELRVYNLRHSNQAFFVSSFFKIGSQELFALAGFEL